ncbi:hypothetical protein EDC01DRAFT_668051 [Geopyxis carbonaria]|nr:hypothetical protein EDC01DRAFT_668051 [Geopyxis carbonaria]
MALSHATKRLANVFQPRRPLIVAVLAHSNSDIGAFRGLWCGQGFGFATAANTCEGKSCDVGNSPEKSPPLVGSSRVIKDILSCYRSQLRATAPKKKKGPPLVGSSRVIKDTPNAPKKKTGPSLVRYVRATKDTPDAPKKNTGPRPVSSSSVIKDTPTAPKKNPDEIDAFFAKYPQFTDYDMNSPWRNEWHKLRKIMNWPLQKRDRKLKNKPVNLAYKQLRIAAVGTFQSMFGEEVDDDEAWRKLCEAICIKPVPDDIADQIRAVMRLHINIVDLIDCARSSPPKCPQRFATEDDLRSYTKKKKGKKYPRLGAEQDGLLVFLLTDKIYGEYNGPLRLDDQGRLPEPLSKQLGIKR